MKRKWISLLLAVSLALGAAGLPVCAQQEEGQQPLTVGESQADFDQSNILDSAVADAQALIDALPTAAQLENMSQDEQATVYEQVQAAYDAYKALTDEQQTQINGAEKFDALFAVFNGMIAPLAEDTYNLNSGSITITEDGTYTITGSGTATTNTITVNSGVTATITLSNVNIDLSSGSGTAFDIQSGANVTLILDGNSTLTSGKDGWGSGSPGIYLPSGASLTIQGSGTLTVNGGSSTGGNGGVGIGGNSGNIGNIASQAGTCGTVTITGGTVNVNGGDGNDVGGAAIGGGNSTSGAGGAGGTVTITGGTVTAIGGDSNGVGAGAGIGGGYGFRGGAGGTVTITGGNVTVRGGSDDSSDIGSSGGAGIGGGGGAVAGGAGGTVIILTPVTVTGGSGGSDTNNGTDIGGGQGSTDGGTGQGIRPTNTSGTYEVYGNLELPDGVTFPNGITINIPDGSSLSLPEGASWPENITLTGNGSISPKLTATITITAYLDKTHDGNAVSLNSSGYTYTGDTTTPTITITWHEDNSGTIGDALTSAPSDPGIYWVKVSAAETSRYAAAEATKQFTISEQLATPTGLAWDSNTPGQATWGAVTNASGYSVQLYKDGSAQGSPVTASGTSYDFASTITQAGSYTFTVTATGSGAYSDSSESSRSAVLHTVSFDMNGGTGTIPMQLVPNGGTATAPAEPTRTGHRFDGWYSDSSFAEGSEWTFATSTVAAATTLYAKWTPLTYKVTLDANGGTINSGNVTEYTYGKGATLPTKDQITREGYTFAGWYDNENFTGSEVTSIGTTETEDKTFYAKWLSADAGVTSVRIVDTEGAIDGTTITVTLPYGSTLPVESSEIEITVADKAEITTDPTTTDSGETWTFTVTAEDGTTTVEYTLTVTIAAPPSPSKPEGGSSSSSSSSSSNSSSSSSNSSSVREPVAEHKVVNSSAYRDGEYDFWMQVKDKIERAQPGDTIRVNARSFDRMPNAVMQALAEADGVTLRITWDHGGEIVIPSQSALQEALRVFYPLSYLETADYPAAAQQASSQPAQAKPAEEQLFAPAQALEQTAPERGLALTQQDAQQGIERPNPETGDGSAPAMVAGAAVLAAVSAGAILLLAHRRKSR